MSKIYKIKWRVMEKESGLSHDNQPKWVDKEAFRTSRDLADQFVRELETAHKLLGFNGPLYPTIEIKDLL